MSLLSEKLAPLWSEISKLKARQMSIFPATVTSVSPVRIRIDGEGQSLAASPTTMDPVFPGNRVRVLRYGTTHLVLGVVGPTVQTGWVNVPDSVSSGAQTDPIDVAFPYPYQAAPHVAISPRGSNRLLFRAYGITRTGFTARARNVSDGGTSDGSFNWLAMPAEAE